MMLQLSSHARSGSRLSPSFRFVALMASLPHLAPLFSQSKPPISGFRLKQRLSVLEEQERKCLEAIVSLTSWESLADEKQDREILRQISTVIDLVQLWPDLVELVAVRMEARTVIAALRRRRQGQTTAGDISDWGYGRWNAIIRENWNEPGFGLSRVMSWVGEANALMTKSDHVGMERLVLLEVFRQMNRFAEEHLFDFEAVVIYVLRWRLIERWSRYEAKGAGERLRELVAKVLETAEEEMP